MDHVAYTLTRPAAAPLPIVIDSPHSGTDYPADFGAALQGSALRGGEDTWVHELYADMMAITRTYTTDALLPSEWPEALRGPDRIERYRYWRGMKLANDPSAWRNFGGTVNYDHRPNFARIQCPCTMVGATLFRDPRPPEQVKWVAEQIKGAKYVEVNSSHYMAYQSPELYLPVLLGFLRDVTA